ncbi:histidine phosphatase family protein [Helcobacillus massiliensis]|uniref:histidine phosphatase family protein n=1 Tax=Helcobacillus massiliensis TaxID=521392 RepID=UPI0021A48E46|nr:histidine phosphatase family protein [Helcobacillus massiliensis]MCT1557268.1 histidine phosphatase family protein [Helcobacillus massiliensis]MCT2036253.1 histidine phosphatase family protein [Helcobacillus massiliensis]MCT2331553.1 histidine phosphatase family protein [Helcobacillus massiliensis]MDK7742162.1 histidine phosphatase family protein [Helcobacillus massiliensis]WOO93716.1 histidine phosphatase family protein [Helcobacillus massiliensis]
MGSLILVRHGQTEHNVEGRLQGQVDIPMNDTGHAQARSVGEALAGHARVHRIWASPLMRAHETALEIGDRLGIDVENDPRLLERSFGQWEGLTREDIAQRWPEKYRDWRSGRAVHGVGVEERDAVADRFVAACRDIMADTPADQTSVVVSHGAAITLGITAMLGLEADGFRGIGGLANCHRTELTYATAGPPTGWMRIVAHNLPPSVPAKVGPATTERARTPEGSRL